MEQDTKKIGIYNRVFCKASGQNACRTPETDRNVLNILTYVCIYIYMIYYVMYIICIYIYIFFMMCFTYVYVRMCIIFFGVTINHQKNNPFITQHCSLRAPGTKTWPWPSWQWKSDAAWPLWRSNETALFYGLLQKTTGLYTKNWFIMFILTSKCQNMGPFKKQCVGCSLLEWQPLKSWHPSWHHCPKKCVQTFFDQSLGFLGGFSAQPCCGHVRGWDVFCFKGCRRCLEAA